MDCIASDLSVMVFNVLFYCLCNYCESNSEELLINLFYSYSYSYIYCNISRVYVNFTDILYTLSLIVLYM